jgi:hypothetical protein
MIFIDRAFPKLSRVGTLCPRGFDQCENSLKPDAWAQVPTLLGLARNLHLPLKPNKSNKH